MEAHLRVVGVLLVGVALIHTAFPWYFRWKRELAGLNLINRQMFYVHTLFIALTTLLMGALCLVSAEEIANTLLGRTIALGLTIFWGARLMIQFFGYSAELWKGRRFETIVHVAFSVLWIYVTGVFVAVWIG